MNAPIVGGAERHTFDLAASLLAHGCRPAIFCMKAGPETAPEGIELQQPHRPRSLPQRILDLGRAIGRFQPDVLVAVNERPMFASFAARLVSRPNVPIVEISHSTILRNRRERLMQIAYRPVFNRVETVVFISRNQRVYWMERGFRPRHDVTILNGVDLGRFAPAGRDRDRDRTRARFGIGPEEMAVGMCAVMRPEKNHLQLVDAIAWLRRQGVAAKALLVGDGPMRTAIEERARSAGAADAVLFAGLHGDVRPFVAAFDVGVLCSVSIETLSLAALEVMAMGIPMVMSDIGGASEIVDGSNGALFPARDDAALRAALLGLRDPEVRRRAGAAARRSVEERFDRQTMLAAYFRLFAERAGMTDRGA